VSDFGLEVLARLHAAGLEVSVDHR
jgi:hypothetical protein